MDRSVLEGAWGKVGLLRNVGNFTNPQSVFLSSYQLPKLTKYSYNRLWKEFEDWPVNSKTNFKVFELVTSKKNDISYLYCAVQGREGIFFFLQETLLFFRSVDLESW